jgi:dTDP-4-dehydrorhamnose reductase
MRILITGASGLLGHAVFQSSKKSGLETYGTYHERRIDEKLVPLDINNKNQLDGTIKKVNPDVIVHTAALTNVDYCEDHREEAWKVNVEGVRNIAEECSKLGIKMVYISTSYVFDGIVGMYDEDAVPNPINYYGLTKLEGEKLAASLPSSLIIRTTWIFDCNFDEKNFAIRLINNLKNGQIVRAPIDQVGNPTLARNLADAIVELVQNNSTGIFNIVGLDNLNRYEFAIKIADALGLNRKLIVAVTSEELAQKARRPKLADLTTDKARRELRKTKLLSLTESIQKFKEEVMKKWEKKN